MIYLAALAGISPDLYEAAVVDGAGRWKQTLHVTLPGLVPTIITLFILNLGHVLNAGFDQIYNMYNPMVYDAADHYRYIRPAADRADGLWAGDRGRAF